jgi:hypothetical protein
VLTTFILQPFQTGRYFWTYVSFPINNRASKHLQKSRETEIAVKNIKLSILHMEAKCYGLILKFHGLTIIKLDNAILYDVLQYLFILYIRHVYNVISLIMLLKLHRSLIPLEIEIREKRYPRMFPLGRNRENWMQRKLILLQ